MYMTEADICQEYRQAKDKQAQIGILAELNLCTQDEIRALLVRNGFLKDLPEKKPAARRNQSRKKGAVSWDTEQARALCEEGRTDREIGEALGVAPSTVCKWRKAEGLPSSRWRNVSKEPGPAERLPEQRTEPPPAQPEEAGARAESEPLTRALPASGVPAAGAGPIALSLEFQGCAFSLWAADLAGAARVYQFAGRVLDDMSHTYERRKEAGNEAEQ